MKKLAQLSYNRRWFVVAGWVVLLFAVFGVSSAVKSDYNTNFELPGSESQSALDLFKAKGRSDQTSGFPGQAVFRADKDLRKPIAVDIGHDRSANRNAEVQ